MDARRTLRIKALTPKPTPDTSWMMQPEEIRARVRALIESGKWTLSSLGRLFNFNARASGDVRDKCITGDDWIRPGELIRMSRVLRMIESGQYRPVITRYIGGKPVIHAALCAPTEPGKPELRASVKNGKAQLVWTKPRTFTAGEMRQDPPIPKFKWRGKHNI